MTPPYPKPEYAIALVYTGEKTINIGECSHTALTDAEIEAAFTEGMDSTDKK